MYCIRKLNRLALRVQSLNQKFACPCAGHQTRHISIKHETNSGKIWQPISVPPSSVLQQLPLFIQQRANHASAGTKLEEFLLPDIGEGISEVVIKGWQVKVGDVVKEFDPICEVESDKATATISSRYNGTIKSVHYEVGEMAKVGKPLVDIELLGVPIETGQTRPESNQSESPNKLATVAGSGNGSTQTDELDRSMSDVRALPSVRRFAQEVNVDLAMIKATGSRGQILKEDVLAYLDAQSAASKVTKPQSSIQEPDKNSAGRQWQSASPTSADQSTSVVPLRAIQRVMFKTMTESLKIPHFNYADEIDLTKLVEAKSQLQSEGSSAKKIANFAFIIKMVSLALQEYPQLNASIDANGENLIHKHQHNIGVAVDTNAGLIVPNIKGVQDLSVEQVNSELLRLRELGYASKLGPADLNGATLTLSNIGAVGGTFGVPVIVSPEIVIGALGRTRKLPRFNSQGQVEARHILQIVWSADHRVVDGATLSRFSNLLKHYLEAPHAALLKLS